MSIIGSIKGRMVPHFPQKFLFFYVISCYSLCRTTGTIFVSQVTQCNKLLQTICFFAFFQCLCHILFETTTLIKNQSNFQGESYYIQHITLLLAHLKIYESHQVYNYLLFLPLWLLLFLIHQNEIDSSVLPFLTRATFAINRNVCCHLVLSLLKQQVTKIIESK